MMRRLDTGGRMDDLRGRVVVVTGGASGIGRASALAFASAGAHVVVADLNRERAAEVTTEASALGPEALACVCDVTSTDDLTAVRDAAIGRFGQVDVVMNNAGVAIFCSPLRTPTETWQRLIDVNLLSVVRGIEVFLPGLVAQGHGHVVNTASTAGLYQYTADMLPYSATKGAVVAISEALALHLRPRGIGITCLCPGPTMTNIHERMAVVGDVQPSMPDLSIIDPGDVGGLVVDAVRNDTFLLLTHPTEVHDILVRKATDPEAYLDAQLAALAEKSA
jgi:NAD(P)-dependent dehydrogenase (short-subunit alcohol dehydrogenase family)